MIDATTRAGFTSAAADHQPLRSSGNAQNVIPTMPTQPRAKLTPTDHSCNSGHNATANIHGMNAYGNASASPWASTGIAKGTVAEVLGGFEEVVLASVAGGEKVTVTGFVSFEQVQRKARTARNPQTGEAIQVKASKAPKVSVGASFKKVIKGEERAPKIRR